MFKFSNGNTRKICKFCSKLTIEIYCPGSGVFIVNFEHISQIVQGVSMVNFEQVDTSWGEKRIWPCSVIAVVLIKGIIQIFGLKVALPNWHVPAQSSQ